MKNNKKYFISDLDGTLIHRQVSELVPREKEQASVKTFVEAGNEFIVATGRTYPDIQRIMKNMDLEMNYAIAENGSEIYKEDELVHGRYLDHDLAVELLAFAQKWGKKVDYFAVSTVGHQMYMKTNTLKGWLNSKRMSSARKSKWHANTMREFKEGNVAITRLLFGGLDAKNLKNMELAMEKEFKEAISVYFTSPFSIEICARGVSKESAMRHILEREGIEEEHVAFVGDSGNDVAVFETLPNSYVMSHASSRFKVGHAQEVERVAYAIEDFMSKWK